LKLNFAWKFPIGHSFDGERNCSRLRQCKSRESSFLDPSH
jgi:hypothetical protein